MVSITVYLHVCSAQIRLVRSGELGALVVQHFVAVVHPISFSSEFQVSCYRRHTAYFQYEVGKAHAPTDRSCLERILP